MSEPYEIVRKKITPDKIVIFISVRDQEFGTPVKIDNPDGWDTELQLFADAMGKQIDKVNELESLAEKL